MNLIYNFVKNNNISKRVFIAYFICIAIIFYFLFSCIFGQKGLIELISLKKQIENQDTIKQELQNKIESKKNMVKSMNTDSLDLDLLDEESRRSLGLSNKNEIVIYNNDQDK